MYLIIFRYIMKQYVMCFYYFILVNNFVDYWYHCNPSYFLVQFDTIDNESNGTEKYMVYVNTFIIPGIF